MEGRDLLSDGDDIIERSQSKAESFLPILAASSV